MKYQNNTNKQNTTMQLQTDFFNKLAKEIDSKYFPTVEYSTKVHYTIELFNNGCINYSKLISLLSKQCCDTKENIHLIVSKFVVDFEGYKYVVRKPKERYTNFKKGDKIIWCSGFGYDIGYFISDDKNQYYHVNCNMVSGVCRGKCSYMVDEVKPYSTELMNELTEKFGYMKAFK